MPLLTGRLARWVSLAILAAVAIWAALQIPLDAPDTSSPPAGSSVSDINNGWSTGQSFVPVHDGLDQVDVVIAAENPVPGTEITFIVKDGPDGAVLRTVRMPVAAIPKGKVMQFRPGSYDQRWTSFHFEPIPDSAGRKLYFSLNGTGIPGEGTAKTLVFFHNEYKFGQAFLNGEPANAHVPFRAYSQGRVSDLLSSISQNLTANKPGPLGSPIPYLALGALYLLLVVLLFRAVLRIKMDSN
jgi:hypothetical protein